MLLWRSSAARSLCSVRSRSRIASVSRSAMRASASSRHDAPVCFHGLNGSSAGGRTKRAGADDCVSALDFGLGTGGMTPLLASGFLHQVVALLASEPAPAVG